MVLRPCDLDEIFGYAFFLERTFEGFEQFFVTFGFLQLVGTVQEFALSQIVDEQLEQIDVDKPKIGSTLCELRFDCFKKLPESEFLLRWVVEDIEADLVAKPSIRQQFLGKEPIEDFPTGSQVRSSSPVRESQ